MVLVRSLLRPLEYGETRPAVRAEQDSKQPTIISQCSAEVVSLSRDQSAGIESLLSRGDYQLQHFRLGYTR